MSIWLENGSRDMRRLSEWNEYCLWLSNQSIVLLLTGGPTPRVEGAEVGEVGERAGDF